MAIVVTDLQRAIPIPASKIKAVAQKIFSALKFKCPDLSIVFVGEQRMRSLNRTHLKHDYVTDVITFSNGEIVICPAVAQRNAKRHKTSTGHELVLYVVHGILHLAGYDDRTLKDIARMRAKEKELMGLL